MSKVVKLNKVPTVAEAEKAIETLLRYMGEDTEREGLKETPARVVKSYGELFSGYNDDITKILAKTFRDISNYSGIVVLKDIALKSTCEHHMQPIIGKVSIGYYPNGEIIGISKLARLVAAFGRRLQTQERLTEQICKSLQEELNPLGVAVQVQASHFCMVARGVNDGNAKMVTKSFSGCFVNNNNKQDEFFKALS